MKFWLLVSLCVPTMALANDEVRTLSLAEAVELAIKSDPSMESALIDRDRQKLGVLRTQLDRISFHIDGQLQELWNKTNIGGPALGSCTVGGLGFSTDQTSCTLEGGLFVASGDQTPALPQGLLNLTANLQVPVFAGFRVDATVKRQQRTEEAAIVQIRRQRRDTALAAARAFWAVRRLELLLAVARSALDRYRESETVAGARVKAGLAPTIDRNRAVTRTLSQVDSIAEYQGELEDAVSQLGVSLGIKGEFRLAGAFTFPDMPAPAAAELIASARRDRPETQSAKLQIDIARQSVRIAKSTYYPQLTLFGLFQYGNNQLSVGTGARDVSSAANPFANVSGDLTLGVSLNMNFFNMLTTYTTTRDAQYETARQVAEQHRTERAIDADVVSSRAKVQRLFSRRGPLRAAVDIARDNAKILEARYKNGEALVIELLDAQVELSRAESSLVDVEAQLEIAWIELRAAMGEQPGRR